MVLHSQPTLTQHPQYDCRASVAEWSDRYLPSIVDIIYCIDIQRNYLISAGDTSIVFDVAVIMKWGLTPIECFQCFTFSQNCTQPQLDCIIRKYNSISFRRNIKSNNKSSIFYDLFIDKKANRKINVSISQIAERLLRRTDIQFPFLRSKFWIRKFSPKS